MEKWAALELKQADLGDKRRNQRLVKIVEDLATQPSSSVPLFVWKHSGSKCRLRVLELTLLSTR